MGGIGDLARVILTFLIFYCFEFSVNDPDFVQLLFILVSISSNVIIHFTHPLLQFYILVYALHALVLQHLFTPGAILRICSALASSAGS